MENKYINEIISSKENKKFKELKSLTTNIGVNKYNKTIVSGKKNILEIIHSKDSKITELISYEDFNCTDKEISEQIHEFQKKKGLIILKKNLFNTLDISNTQLPLIITEIPVMPNWNYKNNKSCTLVLPFQNPINIGSCIRSAAAFGVKKIVILKDAANPFHPKSVRSSAGAVFKIKLYRGPALEELLCEHRKLENLITLDMDGREISSFSFPENFILLPGLEGQGIKKKIKHQTLSLKMDNEIESLNASVSVSVVLFEWRRRIMKKSN